MPMSSSELESEVMERAGNQCELLVLINKTILEVRHELGESGVIDVEELISTVDERTNDIGELTDISNDLRRRWIRALDSSNESPLVQYSRFISERFSSRDEVETLVKNALEKEDQLLQKLTCDYPLIGLSANQLHHECIADESNLPLRGWFEDCLRLAAETHNGIRTFFDTCLHRADKTGQSEILAPFLNDWEKDIEITLAECVNLANVFIIHAQQENCAVFATHIVMPITGEIVVNGKTKKRTPNTSSQEIMAMKKFDFLSKKYRRFFDPRNIVDEEKNIAAVPVIISFEDIRRFLKFYNTFWKNISEGIKPTGSHPSQDKNGAKIIDLKEAASVTSRPRKYEDREPRISICRTGNQFGKFDLRIDQDGAWQVTFDFGTTDYEKTLDCTRKICTGIQSGHLITDLSEVVGKDDADMSRSGNGRYPSIMGAKDVEGFTASDRASLLGSAIVHAGTDIGTRSRGLKISHHFAEHTQNGYQMRGVEFQEIAKAMTIMLTRNIGN